MVECKTCCRSYHKLCLSLPPERDEAFHCPACTARGWHEAPPLSKVPLSGRTREPGAGEKSPSEIFELVESDDDTGAPGNIGSKEQDTRAGPLQDTTTIRPPTFAEAAKTTTSKQGNELETRDDDIENLRSELSELRNKTILLEAENQAMKHKLRGKDAALLRVKTWFDDTETGTRSKVDNLREMLQKAHEL